jgi:hypothetical protein
MMNSKIESWTFTVPLALSAHSQAEKLRRYQSHPQKAKQVYLNTLAVYAVNFYLQCRGFETDWDKSDSCNPAMQILMNVADLVVKNHGKLECRPVLPNAESVNIPAEVWEERIGYVAVQLSESLREATLLGFLDKVVSEELPLSKLRSLEELPRHLYQFSKELVLHQIKPTTNLSKWFENIFAVGWQVLDTLVSTEPTELAFSFRNTLEVKRCKLIELGMPKQAVIMLVAISRASESEINICVEVQPLQSETYLPANLQLMVLDEDGEIVIDARARNDNQSIQLEFSGEPGDHFSIKVALGDMSIIENFVI